MNIAKLARQPRLLPSVLMVGTILLGIKGVGLVHEARAQNADTHAATRAEKSIDAPAPDDSQSTSAAEADVLTSLAKRREKLDLQSEEMATKESLLKATEQRIDGKIAELKAIQAQIQQLLGQRDAEQQKQIAALVKTYSDMKAKDAARIFNSLDDDVLVPVAKEMKPDVLAPILAAMVPETAQRLTIKLANRLVLPETPAAPPTGIAAAPPSSTPMAAAPQANTAAPQPNLALPQANIATPQANIAAPPSPLPSSTAPETAQAATPPPAQAIAMPPPGGPQPAPGHGG
jgi:flagellar motility protein MotE (MotC chaperone)